MACTGYKVVVVGSGGVGRSALAVQLIHNQFIDEWDPTIEDVFRKQLRVDGEDCVMEILDSSLMGGEEYSLVEQYLKPGQGFMIVYSIIRRESFEEITYFKDRILKAQDSKKVALVVVGNKWDLEDDREVATSEGEELARSFGCPFMETSAKTKVNVEESWYQVIREIRKLHHEKKKNKKLTSKQNCTLA